jgi:hypothetical protein
MNVAVIKTLFLWVILGILAVGISKTDGCSPQQEPRFFVGEKGVK